MLRRTHRRRRLARLASLTLLALSPLLALSQEPAASYRLGVFPYLASRQIVEFFGPIAASMGQALQHPVRLESAATFPDFTREVMARSYDIALIQPFDYAEVVGKQGYLPLAQMSVPLVNQFFVRDDSRYRTLEDLRGGIVAMPPAEGANARMALIALNENRLIPGSGVEVRHFNSHDSCIQQVWAGTASACATAKPPILVFEQRMQAKLRPIFASPPLPPVLYVAHPRVPAEHRTRLQALITGWSHTDEGRALLNRVGVPGYVAARPADYAVMRNYEAAASAAPVAPATATTGANLTLGVFPFLSPGVLAQRFAPAQLALGRAAGVAVQLRTATSFDSFGRAVASATHDVVFVQPFAYAKAAERGYVALAGMRDPVSGTFFVLERGPYQAIADFRGKVVAMPPADSAQSRLAYQALVQAGLQPGRDVTIAHHKSHESCLQQVQGGQAVACATNSLARTLQAKELTRGLRTVGHTMQVPGLLFMAHRRLPARTREQLQAEIISWKDSPAGREVLQSIGYGDFVAVNVAAYQRLPQLEAGR